MKVLIVYDSFFGNTEKIANAIAESFKPHNNVTVLHIRDQNPKKNSETDLFIVGSPTRGFRPSEATAKFLAEIPDSSLNGIKVASFDTRIIPGKIPSAFLRILLTVLIRIFGYAAKPISKALIQKGGNQIIEPEGFIVKDTKGPLQEGELERAQKWASQIALNSNNQ